MMMTEHRIIFSANDILKVRVTCPNCKGEIAYLLDSKGPELNSRGITYCLICRNGKLEKADIEIVEQAFHALRRASQMGSRTKYDPTLELTFEIASDSKTS